jgi:hypothetical protein
MNMNTPIIFMRIYLELFNLSECAMAATVKAVGRRQWVFRK